MSKISSSSKRTVTLTAIGLVFGMGALGTYMRATEVDTQVPGGIHGSTSKESPAMGSNLPGSVAPTGKYTEDLPNRLAGVFVDLAEGVIPAVVQVEVRKPGATSYASIPNIPEPFRDFFDIPQGMDSPSRPIPEQMAGGTGFVISPEGYVLTNAHVVDQADRIIVNLVDRTSHVAQLVGVDLTTDLAVIKIDAGALPTLSWGSSKDLRVGEPVMAVGNPGFSGSQALDYTVTTGIVSALGRPLSIIRQSLRDDPDLAGYAIENFIQTDAVINPGNSGGPLVDLHGRVVGVNSAIASSDGHYQGYGFAIPADLAKKVAQGIMEEGHFRRGWLGVSVTGVTSEDAEVYRLPRVGGILVQSVVEKGPADRAGLQVEDVLVSVNGVSVQDSGDLQEQVAELGPDALAELELYREGRRELVSVRLGEVPFSAQRKVEKPSTETGSEALLGMTIADLTPEIASDLGIRDPGGVVVTQVTPWSAAMRKGIVPGMMVKEVGHTPIRSSRDFRQALSGLESGQVVTMKLKDPDGVTRIVNLRAEIQ
jgi:serine protease Do